MWKYSILNMKKETLEEAAINNYKELYEGEPLTQDVPIDAFKQGAEWMQERSYSEEEVILLLQKALTHKDDGEIGSLVTAQGQIRTANFFSWFDKFKNK